jgi:diguanylate cyclase (GGDEF)-like protein
MQVVIVDPSRAVQQAMAKLIEPTGHRVQGFCDAYKALQYLAASRHEDVRTLITSSQPRSLSGIQLCAAARGTLGEHWPLYIMLMSSTEERNLLIKALDSGADDFIRKPPIAEELHAKLRLADRVTSLQRELICHATTDHLTGLLNRRAFFERASSACARGRGASPLSAIMIDLDHFKSVNDTYGHDVGDAVLQAVGREIRLLEGISGRLGGEEFCVLLETDQTNANGRAEALRRAIRSVRFDVNGGFTVTSSLGIAAWEEGDSIDRLLRRADIALYQAKAAGRDRVVDAGTFVITDEHDNWRGAVRNTDR